MITVLLTAVLFIRPMQGRASEGGQSRFDREEEYLLRVRTVLEERGYQDCGLMLNYIREEDGKRSYTLTIHHVRITGLPDEQKGELLDILAEIPFGVEESSVRGKLLDF